MYTSYISEITCISYTPDCLREDILNLLHHNTAGLYVAPLLQ